MASSAHADAPITIIPSTAILRLQWQPFGPIDTSIHVIEDANDRSSPRQPYTSHHAVASEPASDPPTATMRVIADDLEDFPFRWVEEHEPHAFDDPDAVWAPWNPSDALGEDDEDEDHPSGKLLRCCGQDRPGPAPAPLIITATSAPFVTIGDYVKAVHPWLQTMAIEIRRARGLVTGEPIPADEPLHVALHCLNRLSLREGTGAPKSGSIAEWARGEELRLRAAEAADPGYLERERDARERSQPDFLQAMQAIADAQSGNMSIFSAFPPTSTP